MQCICFCNTNIPWGGGENWHLNAALSLATRGWRVLLLCHPAGALYQRALHEPGLTILPQAIGRCSFFNPVLRLRLTRLFRRERVTALVMNLPAEIKIVGPAAAAAGVRHILYRRGSALPVHNSALNRYLFRKILTRLVVNSQATRAQVLQNNPHLLPAAKITVLPNSVDIVAFDRALHAARPLPLHGDGAQGGDAPARIPGADRPFILGNAGRLNRQKGQHLLLRLCKKLTDRGMNTRVLIAGEGEREAELKDLACALGITKRVIFCGFLRNLSPFWKSIDLFVLTSLWEGFGNVLIEAMLAQRPVFAFSVSNLPELIFDGPQGNGKLFPLPAEERANCPEYQLDPTQDVLCPIAEHNGNAPPYSSLGQMAQAVCELAQNPEEAKRMGSAGRAFAMSFSQESCMDTLESLVRKP